MTRDSDSRDSDTAATAAILADVIRTRRTIERFSAQDVPRDALLEAIDVARWAPNHHHTQPWRFHLLGPVTAARMIEINTDLVRKRKGEAAAQIKHERWSAVPAWVVVACHLAEDALTREEDYAACCCAIQNLSLSLWSQGIGLKWSTGDVTRAEAFSQLLGIDPCRERVVGLLSCGYPESIPQSRRRPVEEIVTIHD